ncbi:MAG: PAS domain S-box protein [Nitrospirota bacterium]
MKKESKKPDATKKKTIPLFEDWETIFNAIGHPTFVLDPQFKIVYANKTALDLAQKPLKDLLGKQCAEVFQAPPSAISSTCCPLQKMMASGHTEIAETTMDVNGRHFLFSCTPLFDKKGNLEKIIHIATDITDHKKAEHALLQSRMQTQRALEQSERRFRILWEHAAMGIAMGRLGADCFIDVNKKYADIVGYTQEELLHISVYDLTHPEDVPASREFQRKLKTGELKEYVQEKRYIKKNGHVAWVNIGVSSIDIPHEQASYQMLMAQDITGRKQAELLLEESRRHASLLSDMISQSSQPFITGYLDGRIGICNEALSQLLGYTKSELLGLNWITDLTPVEWRSKELAFFNELEKTGKPVRFIKEAIRKDGSRVPIELFVHRMEDSNHRFLYYYGFITDITDRKKAENALLYAEKKFRGLLETIGLAAVMLDMNGSIIFCNNYFLALTGWSNTEILGKNWFELFIPDEFREAAQSFFRFNMTSGTMPLHHEFVIKTRNDVTRIMVWDTTVLLGPDDAVMGIASIGMDVTDHRMLEEQLRQAQKLEAVGRLTGGVAHDFNNILSAVVGYSQISLMKMTPDDPLRNNLEIILKAAERATTLTQSLLSFSRKQLINPKPQNLNQIVKGLDTFLIRLIREDIEIKTLCSECSLNVHVDQTQIEQILVNLITNARDAMQEGGCITIKTDVMHLDAHFIDTHGYGRIGEYAFVSVSDTGEGMDAGTREKIFEPFFTTKEQGKGTGLGLSMAYGAVKQHKGYINVESEQGKGTTVSIYLPLIKETIKEEPEGIPSITASGGSETILIAEDDTSLRNLTSIILSNAGYQVIEAVDGQDAVEQFEKKRDVIQLVILDMVMPRQKGRQAYWKIRDIKPSIKALYVSGYTHDSLGKEGEPDSNITVLLKPIIPTDLLKKVRATLDA